MILYFKQTARTVYNDSLINFFVKVFSERTCYCKRLMAVKIFKYKGSGISYSFQMWLSPYSLKKYVLVVYFCCLTGYATWNPLCFTLSPFFDKATDRQLPDRVLTMQLSTWHLRNEAVSHLKHNPFPNLTVWCLYWLAHMIKHKETHNGAVACMWKRK